MMKQITLVLLLILVLPFASADIIIQKVDETSGIVLDGTLDVELRNATVEINIEKGYLSAIFEVYSNENEVQKTRVYLKAKGQDCYRISCHDVDVAESTSFNINNDLHPGEVASPSFEGISSFADVYETNEGKFAGVNFDLLPNQINTIKVYQEITTPFEYYLDSLSTFSKAEHEKITIYGNVSVKFNDEYPVRKVSENEFVWEYSNIDVTDSSLKDKVIITSKNSKIQTPKQSNLYWIIGIIIITLLLLIFVVSMIRRKNEKIN